MAMNGRFANAAKNWMVSGLGVALCLLTTCITGQASATELVAFTKQKVHPVLIRNDHNALLEVVVQVKDQATVVVKSMTFGFEGTDSLSDLASIQLFATGDKGEFATENAFDESSQAAEQIRFDGDQKLGPGENYFWLSCRLQPGADLSHRVDAACLSIDTSAGTLVPTDRSPGVRHRIGVALRRHNDDGVHTYRIPALTTTPKRTLLCVYDMRRRMSRDLQEDIDIGLSRSVDGGQTWESPQVIMDMGEYGELPQEQNGCSDPGIIVDQVTGDIYCFAVWMWGKPGKHQWTDDGSEPGYEIGKSAQLLMVHSQDDGRTWSQPQNLTRTLKKEAWWLLAPSPQQGINLADGTLVMPAEGRDAQGIPFATLLVSDDHGATWTVGEPAFSGGNECQAVQLGDGSIMLNMRNDHERYRAVFVTEDLGKTWRPHETNRETLIEPNCNGSLYRVDYGTGDQRKHVLLFANPHSQERRTHQTVQVSFDDGLTWPQAHHLLLDEGLGRGYPSISRIDDDHVGIVYEGSQADLVFERLALAELLKN
jgi:sialidase-1